MDKNYTELGKIKEIQEIHTRELWAISQDLTKIKTYQEKLIVTDLKRIALEQVIDEQRRKRSKWIKVLVGIPPAVSVIGFVYFVEAMNWIHDDLLKIGL